MSWSVQKVGRVGVLAGSIKEIFEKTGGCPVGTAEETAKNALGGVMETLCGSFDDPARVVSIEASGSAWNSEGKAKSQSLNIKFTTLGDFVE